MSGSKRGAVAADVWAVLFDIERERAAQDEKWGQQDHPDLPGWADGTAAPQTLLGIDRTAAQARTQVDASFEAGYPNWAEILLEELCESFEEINNEEPNTALRTELIQTAAVIVAWVQAIDRRAGEQPPLTVVASDENG